MLALFSNIDFTEMIVIATVALLVFGKRLPEVAVRAAAQLTRARRSLNEMWRQTGLEDELRRVRRDIDQEQRRIELQIPDWRKDLPSWNKLQSEAQALGKMVDDASVSAPTPEATANAPYNRASPPPNLGERMRTAAPPSAPPGWLPEEQQASTEHVAPTPEEPKPEASA